MAEEKPNTPPVVVPKTAPTLESLAKRKWAFNEKALPDDESTLRVVRSVETQVDGKGNIVDTVVQLKRPTTITTKQFKAMPLYYVRKHGLWHLITDMTEAEQSLVKQTPARRLIGYYTGANAQV